MNKDLVKEWIKHILDPKNNGRPQIPDGVTVADVRTFILGELCEKFKVKMHKEDIFLSLPDCANAMNAEMPVGDVDTQSCKLFALAFPVMYNMDSSPSRRPE